MSATNVAEMFDQMPLDRLAIIRGLLAVERQAAINPDTSMNDGIYFLHGLQMLHMVIEELWPSTEEIRKDAVGYPGNRI